MVVAVVICAVASITVWASIMHTDVDFSLYNMRGAGGVFALILFFQIAILLIGGGIYCLQSVHREKELNTFDYQRVTRLTSLELTFGKLFGSPIAAYFAVLCLMPVALIAAAKAHLPATIVLETYLVMFVGAVTYHALAVLISLFFGRGGTALAVLLFLAIVGFTWVPGFYSHWTIRTLSPFFAGDVLHSYSSELGNHAAEAAERTIGIKDAFFRAVVPHLVVYILIHATLAAWLLLAIKRNLKRDPSMYEIYSPVQAFTFALYIGFLTIAFFPWKTVFMEGPVVRVGNFVFRAKPTLPYVVEQLLLQAAVVLMAVLGLALLRNRERVRRRMRELGDRAAGWLAAVWPAPYIVATTGLMGAVVVLLVGRYRYAGSDWNLGLAIYTIAFLAVWLTRDALYLQWMYVRRARRPLLSAALYLTVFYFAVGILFSAFNLYGDPRSAASTALLFPTPLFALSPAWWTQQKQLWLAALVVQCAAAVVFAVLHRLRLRDFLLSTSEAAQAR